MEKSESDYDFIYASVIFVLNLGMELLG